MAIHRTDTIRRRRRDPKGWAELKAHRDAKVERIRTIDRSMADMAAERNALAAEVHDLDDELWPPAEWPQGRRPGTDTLEEALPPLPHKPRWLWGRRLRNVCLRLLQRCGTLPLRQLHALLHLHGFGIAGAHPVKALADALGHETDAGNARRVGRGLYSLAPGYQPRSRRPGLLDGVLLPDLDE